MLHSTHHTPGDDVCGYVESFSQDPVYAVSRGDFLTEKCVILGTGLLSLICQKTPIKLSGGLGHSCAYDLVPASDTGKVLTYLWWDNFDIKTMHKGVCTQLMV